MYRLSSSLVSALLSLSAAACGWPTVSAPVVVRDYKPCCNNSSQHGFAWTVVGFQYNASYIFSTPAHQIDYGVVAFNLTNPALASPAVCSATSTQLQDYFYGDMIYKCSSDAGNTTTFTFNAPSEVLTWNQTWVCADANPVYPTTFTYRGAVNLALDLYETFYQNGNWTMGQIYSRQFIERTTADFSVAPLPDEA